MFKTVVINFLGAGCVIFGAVIMKKVVCENIPYEDPVFKMGTGLCLIGSGAVLNTNHLIGSRSTTAFMSAGITLCIINPFLSDVIIQLKRTYNPIGNNNVVNPIHNE